MTSKPFLEDFSSTESSVVAIFHGAVSDIPEGWIVADGKNGSPNLLDRIPKGNPDYTTEKTTGGANSKTLSASHLPEHNHSASVDSAGNHAHGIGQSGVAEGASYDYIDSDGNGFTSTSSDGAHSHSNGGAVDSVGSGASIDNRAKSIEVIYIYKV